MDDERLAITSDGITEVRNAKFLRHYTAGWNAAIDAAKEAARASNAWPQDEVVRRVMGALMNKLDALKSAPNAEAKGGDDGE